MEAELTQAREALAALDESVSAEFDVEVRGLRWFGSIEDASVRVVRSNQLIELIGTSRSHLDAVAEASRQVAELVGPNGQTMPVPGDSEALARQDRVWVEITDGLRAAGSLFDVFGGLATLFLGLSHPPARADSRQLMDCGPLPSGASEEQRATAEAFSRVISAAIAEGPEGWLEWMLESRNAMVHRGRGIASWFAARAPAPTLLYVVSDQPPARLLRYVPRIRRLPDLSDAEAVLTAVQFEDLYLPEPAEKTLEGLARQSAVVVTEAASYLSSILEVLSGFTWPGEQWRLRGRPERAVRADAFRGFDGSGTSFGTDAIVLNPQTADRLLAAEEVRRGNEADSESE